MWRGGVGWANPDEAGTGARVVAGRAAVLIRCRLESYQPPAAREDRSTGDEVAPISGHRRAIVSVPVAGGMHMNYAPRCAYAFSPSSPEGHHECARCLSVCQWSPRCTE